MGGKINMKDSLYIVTSCYIVLAAAATLDVRGQIVDVGSHDLLPNTPDQVITINVTGVSGARGLDLYVQVGDGYPDVSGSVNDGPNITSVDVVTGTLFDSNNLGGQSGSGLGLQNRFREVLTAHDTVSGSGLLATLRIDTTGFTSGTWSLSLKDVFNGTTTFFDASLNPIPINITDGSITVVPEPVASGVVAGLLLLAVVLCRRFAKPRQRTFSA
jgi:hypothetical protein